MRLYFLSIFFILLVNNLLAEGTKQLRPATGDFGYIQINDRGRTFATYAAKEDERLYIRVNSKREKVYFGFGRVLNGSSAATDVYYRIKNPQGVVVSGPTRIRNTGVGFISSYTAATRGPNKINALGYNPFVFAPTDTGDYYIEFNQGSPTNISTPNEEKRVFEMFDITVVDTVSLTAKDGRVWSKNWDITTNSGSNGFKGTFYVYSYDGVVTSINFNGMQPHAFTLACNSTGTTDSGNPDSDRKSKIGNHTYADYKIFLNDPDIDVYPNGVIGSLQASLTLTGCAPDYCININTDARGYVEFVVDLNGQPGYQANSKDLIFGQTVAAGLTCIPWDGKDGQGNVLSQTVNFQILAEYKFGLTNLPIYDVENFSGGFIVSSIRPLVIKPKLFWDDRNIPGGGSNLTGCISNSCHPWPSNNFGDDRTINTWWYVNVQRDTIISQTIPKPNPAITGLTTFCDTSTTSTYSTPSLPGHQYKWKSKIGTFLTNDDNSSITFKPGHGIDTLTVLESNAIGCYEDTIIIRNYPKPLPDVQGDSVVCYINTVETYSTPSVNLNTYQWSVFGGTVIAGQSTNSVQVRWTNTGHRWVEVRETNPNNCFTVGHKDVDVYPKPPTSSISH